MILNAKLIANFASSFYCEMFCFSVLHYHRVDSRVAKSAGFELKPKHSRNTLHWAVNSFDRKRFLKLMPKDDVKKHIQYLPKKSPNSSLRQLSLWSSDEPVSISGYVNQKDIIVRTKTIEWTKMTQMYAMIKTQRKKGTERNVLKHIVVKFSQNIKYHYKLVRARWSDK